MNVNSKRTVYSAPAKINLSLNITGRLANGYHSLKMVMQSIDLCDTVAVTAAESDEEQILITCSEPSVPTDERNIAFKCARAFFEQTSIPCGRVSIDIVKRIPSQAGLAGGSADGAAVLAALNDIFFTGLSDDELCKLGVKCGADIPFCIKGGTMLAEGIGEKLSPAPRLPDCYIALAKPECGVNTAAAFNAFDREGCFSDGGEALLNALSSGDLRLIGESASNALEAVCAPYESKEIKRIMLESGAYGSVMTGSGSAVFGLFPSYSDAEGCLKKTGAAFTKICRPQSRGVIKAGQV